MGARWAWGSAPILLLQVSSFCLPPASTGSSAFHGTASSGDLPRRSRHPRVRCGNPGVDNRRGEGGLRGPLCSPEPVLGPTVSSSSQPEDLGHEVTRRVPPDNQSDPKYPCRITVSHTREPAWFLSPKGVGPDAPKLPHPGSDPGPACTLWEDCIRMPPRS